MKSITTNKYILGLFQLIFAIAVLNAAAYAATYTVTTINDGVGIPGSLREAINAANSTSDATFFININIGAGGLKTITPTSPMPAINVPNSTTVIIDATTMPGYAGTPLLQLSGTLAGPSANGLTVIRGNVIIRGFIINNFSQYGVSLQCPNMAENCNTFGALSVYGSYIGTTADGSTPFGNTNGIYLRTHEVFGAANSTPSNIGGTGANQRNIISGNDFNGIVVDSPQSFNDIRIVNNYIGTNPLGTAAVPNGSNGIYLLDTTPGSSMPSNIDVYVGGSNAGERNVISGNGENGIRVDEPAINLWVRGNFIGANAAGTGDLGNAQNGVLHSEANLGGSYQIGGKAAGEGNVISGNNQNGIKSGASSIGIYGNRIGTNAGGTAALPNTLDGIYLTKGATIGDTLSNGGNTISGNGDDGIHVAASTFPVLIWGNRIGVNAGGTAIVPNGGNGIRLAAPAIVGASGPTQYNIIGGNASDGILLAAGGAQGSEIKRNYIGTNAAGADLGNTGHGISAFGSILEVIIGDTTGGGNTIAFNDGDGIYLQPGFSAAIPDYFSIRGNSIYSNDGVGIDLGPTNGITPNDFLDADTGPNGLQNFPILQMAHTTSVSGSLNSTPGKDFAIDFYRVDSCDASGNGEGRYYLGTTQVQTGANGTANFTASLTSSVSAGQVIVATASEKQFASLHSRTSEFSPCLTVSPPPGDVKLSSATYSASESNANVAIIVSRSGGSSGTITVDYATSNGTAIAGQDYTATSGTLTFANGETGKLISIPVTNDASDEPDETLNFTLSNPTGGASLINPSTAVVTITDNDAPPTVSVNDISVVEGNENLTPFSFTVSLSEASGFATSVNWATAAGTANATSDFQANSGTVNFAPGETAKQISVQVYGETLVEINETFSVNLSLPTAATLGDGTGIGTILDDDNPGKFSFSLAPYNLSEAGGSATVTVVRTNGDAGTASVDYMTGGGTATPFADFTPVSGTLVFLDGETQKTFTVPVLEDQIAEQTESINLLLSSPTGGATLGIAAAVINILDNDSGTQLAISGNIKKPDNTPLAGASVTLTGTHNVTATTAANGDYSFSSLTPGGSYSVTPSAIGYTFAPIEHQYAGLAASVTNANFTATDAPSRALRIVGSDTVPGQPAVAVVELVAQGDENSVGFSVSFDPAVLNGPQAALLSDAASGTLIVNESQAASGRLGLIIALPAGQTFAAGTRQLATLTFNSAVVGSYSTPVDFGDIPVLKQLVNVNADPLPASYTNGTISFAQGYEGDVAPRPTGSMNGSVTVADFTQIGRFVAGLNTPDQTNEFQRSDVAPRISKGDGLLTVSDYTQAGRYAAGLDPVQTAGGPTQASLAAPESNVVREALFPDGGARAVRVVSAQTSPGQQVFVPIRIDSQGDENSFGFSLGYDASKLSNPVVTLGADTAGATMIPNTSQLGKVGVLVGLPAGTSLSVGDRHLVTVRFDVAAGATAGQTPLVFGDEPIAREVVDANVNVLTASYTDGAVNILGPTGASVTVGGRVLNATGRGIVKAIVTMTDSSGNTRTAVTSSSGFYRFEGVETGHAYIFSASAKRYEFDPPSQVVMIVDELLNIDFTAQRSSSAASGPEEER